MTLQPKSNNVPDVQPAEAAVGNPTLVPGSENAVTVAGGAAAGGVAVPADENPKQLDDCKQTNLDQVKTTAKE